MLFKQGAHIIVVNVFDANTSCLCVSHKVVTQTGRQAGLQMLGLMPEHSCTWEMIIWMRPSYLYISRASAASMQSLYSAAKCIILVQENMLTISILN